MRTALAVIGGVLLLTACDTSPGVVTGTHQSLLGDQTHYFITVRHDQSQISTDEDVSLGDYAACDVGDRYPDCTR